ncbi:MULTISPECIES: bifunctional aspartate transaminase/aspartate 4-decarboxylase [Ensifer]|uniref:Aspartate 4-decarboxylase n=1 Tax=Ensifer canadensis TaxID=555315 RepID=A0AAW4FEW6_9HYPH|nr:MULTISPECIES: bifunctional aspartate transaminase/aspartate 4-decarboxylase [Ensifer]MDP9629442.1 aspartate 4-decarboxylase [Ensifer adhaerens]KQW50192.1 aspartate 4-decarboxylase [Ensifer sp. Root1252]KQY62953.1 aspartate 4-decarboxylase [Ensifer sp. Root142]KRC74416.1 aspartate 4-decarboxylase [Ensifer sp. Root231]KRD03129.1 aspartate 4-decarboxylase [Ensifer sp. Root258]
MADIDYREYEKMSPFEIKDGLMKLAKRSAQKSTNALLNAGRGNPNWIATTPREGFFLFGQFALTESRRTMDNPAAGLGGMPQMKGIAARFDAWLAKHAEDPGADFLSRMVEHGVKMFGFDADAFVFELTDSIIGDNYPVPDRMLVHAEQVAHRYLMWAMGANAPIGKFDLYAVEGGTAAMCYIFKSLIANRILKKGDTIAMGTPIFTPYIEIAELEDYAFKAVHVRATQEHRFQYSDEEIRKLEDPKIKAFFVVNPGNPTSMAIDPQTMKKLVDLVNTKRPDLILLTDDVYGTFVPNFRSLMCELPYNTICVYSYSKYFGCTGWRLGVIGINEKNILDDLLTKLPAKELEALDNRYRSITLEPRKLKMIDRIVADSRDVALNHTAGLSLPQQVMMTMFSISELMDTDKVYQKACMAICTDRVNMLLEGLPLDLQPNANFAGYYGTIDFEFWLRKYVGEEMVAWLKANVHPLDLVYRLAEDHSIVLLNGGGFDAPNWSVRVSFANLPDDVYDDIGRGVRAVGRGYVDTFNALKGK